MKNNTFSEFCIGDRNIKGQSLGLISQFPLLGLYALIGIPGMIYAYGAGRAWFAIGIFIGCVLNWRIMPYRLMRFSVKQSDTYTLPQYLSRRFNEKGKLLRSLFAIVLMTLCFLTMLAAINIVGNMFEKLGIMSYEYLAFLCILIAAVCVLFGGLLFVGKTKYLQVIFTLVIIVTIPAIILHSLDVRALVLNIMHSRVAGGASVFLNVIYEDGHLIEPASVISQMSWGICCMGIPNTLTFFLTAKNGKVINKGKVVGVLFTLLLLVSACVAGALSRAYLYPSILGDEKALSEGVLIETVRKFMDKTGLYFLLAVFILAVIFALIATLEVLIFVISTVLYNDIILGLLKNKKESKIRMLYQKTVVIIVSLILFFAVISEKNDMSELLKLCFMLYGCAIGPTILMSLYSGKMNKYGALAGVFSGSISVFVWSFANIVSFGGEMITLEKYVEINAIIPSFVVSVFFIILISAVTGSVSEEIKKNFEDVKNRII